MKTHYLLLFNLLLPFLIFSQETSFEWAKQLRGLNGNQITSTGFSQGNSIAVDTDGNVYSMGAFGGMVDFDPGIGSYQLNSLARSDLYVSKLDNKGNFLWSRNIGGDKDIYGLSIALDSHGNVYITGRFTDTVDFDPGNGLMTLYAVAFDAFVLKLSSSGDFRWVRQLSSLENCTGESIELDSHGFVYVAGTFMGSTDFDQFKGKEVLSPHIYKDIFILKLDPFGQFQWVKQYRNYFMGSIGNENINIDVDSEDNVYSTGIFLDSMDFDPGVDSFFLSSNSFEPDIFISKLDSKGNFLWAKQVGGNGMKLAKSIHLDNQGNIIYSGIFTDIVDFDPGISTYELIGSREENNRHFISKLDTSGNFVWAKQLGGWNAYSQSFDRNITTDKKANIYISGSFAEKTDFDPGTDTMFLNSSTEIVYIAKFTEAGNFEWVKTFGTLNAGSSNLGSSIALDENQNIFTTGCFFDTVDFDPGDSTYYLQSLHYDAFIHKINQCNSRSVQKDTACNFYVWNGRKFQSSGIYYDTIANTAGCDSIMQLHLTIVEFNNKVSTDFPILHANLSNAIYQWMDCKKGIPVKNESRQSFEVKKNGSYAVILSKSICKDTSDCVDISGFPNAFEISPNPAKDQVQLHFLNDVQDMDISITDARERLVEKIDGFSGSQLTINLANHPRGTYFVSVELDGEIQREKLIKR